MMKHRPHSKEKKTLSMPGLIVRIAAKKSIRMAESHIIIKYWELYSLTQTAVRSFPYAQSPLRNKMEQLKMIAKEMPVIGF